MNKFLKLPIFLGAVGMIATFVLAFVFQLTDPIIQERTAAAETESLKSMYPNSTIEVLNTDLDECETAAGLVKVYAAKSGSSVEGYLYKCTVSGYKGGEISFIIAISSEGKYQGYKVITMTDQTSGIGDKVAGEGFYSQFLGNQVGVEISTIAGATISSEPVVNAIKYASAHYYENYK